MRGNSSSRLQEGFRRLSHLLGGLGSLSWVVYAFVASKEFSTLKGGYWVLFILGIPVCFAVPFLLVKVVYWVIAGFMGGGKESGGHQSDK
jgi:hypothetical protein